MTIYRLGLLALAFAPALAGFAAESARQPNVVLVMTDDQGYGDLGCHGNTMIRTPNFDRLHEQSLRLTNFHVDPTCSPTRSALMTGRYSSRTGVWHTIAGRSILRRDETTMADVFSAAGYRTGIFGKWHLGDNYPSRPQDRGFDEVLIHGGGGVTQTPDYWGNTYFNDIYFHNGRPEKFSGYCTDVFFDAALSFIEQNRERPFLCYLPTNAPHGPYNVADRYSRPYREQGVPEAMANFYGMITNIDENMGRLVSRLEELGLADNTILIFMTDNGTAQGVAGERRGKKAAVESDGTWSGFSAGMRAQKGSQYEGGHRVPFFIRWPNKLPAGRDFGRLTAHIDVLPTLIDLCGLSPPAVKFDGTSLKPALSGAAELPERTLFVHSQRIEHPQKWKTSAVMTERWRLIDGRELYDIQADPSQQQDVAERHADIVAQLRAGYERWWSDISQRFDEYVEIVIGADEENPARLTCHDWHAEDVMIPWSQQAVKQAPLVNGFWAVEVARDGRYEFTLRQQPAQANYSLDAVSARVAVAGVEGTATVPQGATSVTWTAELKAGKSRLQTWLTRADGQSRGAYFVEIRKVQ